MMRRNANSRELARLHTPSITGAVSINLHLQSSAEDYRVLNDMLPILIMTFLCVACVTIRADWTDLRRAWILPAGAMALLLLGVSIVYSVALIDRSGKVAFPAGIALLFFSTCIAVRAFFANANPAIRAGIFFSVVGAALAILSTGFPRRATDPRSCYIRMLRLWKTMEKNVDAYSRQWDELLTELEAEGQSVLVSRGYLEVPAYCDDPDRPYVFSTGKGEYGWGCHEHGTQADLRGQLIREQWQLPRGL